MSVTPFPKRAQTAAEEVRSMEQQARNAALRVSTDLNRDLADIALECGGAAAMGSLPPGVRDVYRKLGEQIAAGLKTIEIVTGRPK